MKAMLLRLLLTEQNNNYRRRARLPHEY